MLWPSAVGDTSSVKSNLNFYGVVSEVDLFLVLMLLLLVVDGGHEGIGPECLIVIHSIDVGVVVRGRVTEFRLDVVSGIGLRSSPFDLA